MLARHKIDRLVERAETIDRRLSAPVDRDTLVSLNRERAELEPVIAVVRELRAAESERADLDSLLDDAEMAEMARSEAEALDDRIARLSDEIQRLLLPKDVADERSAILEIRAGTGGDEAALFASDLFRMYSRYADIHGWTVETMSSSDSEAGGYKEVIATITGKGVFARLKFESGVHRVQRVPVTEGSGRIHTSAATVAVLPEAEEVDIVIRAEDLRIETTRAQTAGGQHANTTDSGIRMHHIPTGIIVISNDRSQHKNRARAMQVMRARLYDLERQKLADERSEARRGQVGSGDRSERIRTYNFPQGRVTDHRINLTVYALDDVLSGSGLDLLIDPLITNHRAELMAAEEEATQ